MAQANIDKSLLENIRSLDLEAKFDAIVTSTQKKFAAIANEAISLPAAISQEYEKFRELLNNTQKTLESLPKSMQQELEGKAEIPDVSPTVEPGPSAGGIGHGPGR